MYASTAWINDYLDRPASPDEQVLLLIEHSFPLEGRESLGSGEERLDVELTSNRGDCLSHVGLAREIAAASGRTHRPPHPNPNVRGPAASKSVKVTNHEKELCPLYTARVIRGVKVKPSPDWLANRLRAIDQIPRNTIVDLSNFVLFEMGQPTHVFDLKTLKGSEIIIRMAKAAEPFLPIGEGEKEIKLSDQDLVIADAERAVAIAGVKGGALTAVSQSTTDILIEAAAFDPVAVRTTSRRLGIASDSSYRFERGVHPGQVNRAADRLAGLILELAGGELCEGVVFDGATIPTPRSVSMRPDRCRKILGIDIEDARMIDWLTCLGFTVKRAGGALTCAVPVERLDVEREIDLIEEIGRMHGYDSVPVRNRLEVRIAGPQSEEQAQRAVFNTLVGLGYVETVTHSLVSERAAQAFIPPDMQTLRVADERARAEPVLRPSILASLLRVYAFNRDRGARDVRLFERAATFAATNGEPLERVNLALLEPVDARTPDVRRTRGTIDRLVELVLGPGATIDVEPLVAFNWYSSGAVIRVDGAVLGTFGLISPKVAQMFDLDEPLCGAEIGLPRYYDRYPPVTQAHELPQFPPIERDLSVVVDEPVRWNQVRQIVSHVQLKHLEALEFVTTFRGKPIPAGRKSMTLRVRFRAADRTLTNDEVDDQVQRLAEALCKELHGEIRR